MEAQFLYNDGPSEYIMGFEYSQCDSQEAMYYQEEACDALVEGVQYGLEEEMGTTLQDFRSYCAYRDVCIDDSCVAESDRVGGFPVWAICLIVIIILLILTAIVLVYFCRERKVAQEPTPVPMEEIVVQEEDPREHLNVGFNDIYA